MHAAGRIRAPARWAAFLAVFLALTWLPGLASAAPTFPKLTGRVVDDAGILPPQVEGDLSSALQALEDETGNQLVVVTLPGLQGYEIEEYGYQLGRAWGIGQKESDSGALFIIAPKERRVRIEVGYGLEPVLTDALTRLIIENEVVPSFKQGDMVGGIVAGTKAIIAQLSLPPDEARARAHLAVSSPARDAHSGGGWWILIWVLFLLFFMFRRRGGRRYRRRGFGAPVILWGPGSGGGFGGGSGGFGGGGSFGGGGGSFGGGGSSGSW